VVPVTQSGSRVTLEGEGEPIEWAVKMQRLPDEATLHARLARGTVDIALVEKLAQRLAAFHRTAPSGDKIAPFGRFDAVARNIRDIFRQSVPQVGNTISKAVFDRLEAMTEELLARLAPLIEERARRGLTRDCHGDLHLDHVYYFPDRPPPGDLVIVDCIEFTERFRYIDPVADMAFPVMDFVFHGRRDLARSFTEAYFRASQDEQGRALLPLYTAYRATVRGSVQGLKLAEKEVPPSERVADLQHAKAHWLVALGELAEPARRPCLLLVGGLPGTGKSSLARWLAEKANFTVLRSDVVRKELAGLPATVRSPASAQATLYAREWTERTYAECLRRAENLLFEGQRVIVDATFREDARRQTFLESARRWAVPGAVLLCRADAETVHKRLAQRQGDASDADWSVYETMTGHWEEPGESVRPWVRFIDTAVALEDAGRHASEALREWDLLR
jgi:hypothetical protein